MDLRETIGRVLALLSLGCAVVDIFVLKGTSIEFPGILLGGLGYYFSLASQDRVARSWASPRRSST